jgi:phosphomevalonate kinase
MRRNTEWSSIPTSSPAHQVSAAESLSLFSSLEQEVLDLLLSIRNSFIRCRADLKLMGQSAGTEIEPDQQTLLADATTALPGVLCSGVPGAGGVDAIYALVLSPEARQNVEKMWSTWGNHGAQTGQSAECRVCPLLLSVDQGKHAGIQLEP